MSFLPAEDPLSTFDLKEVELGDHDDFEWLKKGLIERERPLDELWMNNIGRRRFRV